MIESPGYRLLTLPALVCALFVAACAARRVRDCGFDITGFVAAEAGAPLQSVEVILQVETPIKGAFIFRCLSHNSVTKYTLMVRKEGFEPQTVSGSAPPDGHHTFRMKRAGG